MNNDLTQLYTYTLEDVSVVKRKSHVALEANDISNTKLTIVADHQLVFFICRHSICMGIDESIGLCYRQVHSYKISWERENKAG